MVSPCLPPSPHICWPGPNIWMDAVHAVKIMIHYQNKCLGVIRILGNLRRKNSCNYVFFFLESNRNFVCHKYNLIKLLYQIKTTESTREDRKKQGDHIHNSSTHDASPSGVRRPLKKVEMRPMGKNLTPLACTL